MSRGRKSKLKQSDYTWIRKYHRQHSIREMAEKLGVGIGSIRKALLRLNLDQGAASTSRLVEAAVLNDQESLILSTLKQCPTYKATMDTLSLDEQSIYSNHAILEIIDLSRDGQLPTPEINTILDYCLSYIREHRLGLLEKIDNISKSKEISLEFNLRNNMRDSLRATRKQRLGTISESATQFIDAIKALKNLEKSGNVSSMVFRFIYDKKLAENGQNN